MTAGGTRRRGPSPVRLSTGQREEGVQCGEGIPGLLAFDPENLDLEGVPGFKEAVCVTGLDTSGEYLFTYP